MIRRPFLAGIAVAIAIAAPTVQAQSAHVHGEGRVNIAIEGDRIFIALEAPGADIVGFEYAPRSDADKAAVAAALAQLAEPAQWLRLDDEAECRVIEKSAELDSGAHDHGEQHEHDQHGRNDEQHDPSEHHEHDEDHDHEGHEEGHDDHADEDAHSAFIAEYVLECGAIEALNAIEFDYFVRFDGARSLDIVLIDGSGQRRIEVDRANPVLRLAP